jgi:hypothetical protein
LSDFAVVLCGFATGGGSRIALAADVEEGGKREEAIERSSGVLFPLYELRKLEFRSLGPARLRIDLLSFDWKSLSDSLSATALSRSRSSVRQRQPN